MPVAVVKRSQAEARGRISGLSMACSVLAVMVAWGGVAVQPVRVAASEPNIAAVERICEGPSALDHFRHPRGLVADSARQVFLVADTGNHRIVVFDATGRSRGAIRFAAEQAGGAPGEPISMALDRRGHIFLIDAIRTDVEVLSPTGSHIAYIDPPLPAEARGVSRPQAIAIGASGRIYLACAGERSGLLVLAPNGTLAATYGFPAPGTESWQGPTGVAVNADESLIVVLDPQADKAVWIYNADGTLAGAYGEHGTGDGTFSMACHATFDPDGDIWVTDTLRHSITVLDPKGGYRGRIGGFGAEPGQFNHPASCAFLNRDRLVVLERAGTRCQIFQLATEAVPAEEARSGASRPNENPPAEQLALTAGEPGK